MQDANSIQTIRIWSNIGNAMKRGASWGDISVYNRQEMDEVLEERRRRSSTVMPEPITIKIPIVPETIIIERETPCAAPLSEYEPFIEKPKTKPKPKPAVFSSKRPLCMGCGKFCIHSKPPDSWNAADRKRYCCLGCRDSAGKKHADRCQKHELR